MNEHTKKKIIIYDFDGTLTPYSLPKFEILEKCGVKDGMRNPLFLELSQKRAKNDNIDLYTAIYSTFFDYLKKSNFKLTDDNLTLGYDNIQYNNGVKEFLEMLCKNHVKLITTY